MSAAQLRVQKGMSVPPPSSPLCFLSVLLWCLITCAKEEFSWFESRCFDRGILPCCTQSLGSLLDGRRSLRSLAPLLTTRLDRIGTPKYDEDGFPRSNQCLVVQSDTYTRWRYVNHPHSRNEVSRERVWRPPACDVWLTGRNVSRWSIQIYIQHQPELSTWTTQGTLYTEGMSPSTPLDFCCCGKSW
jgi:hypothetical protein